MLRTSRPRVLAIADKPQREAGPVLTRFFSPPKVVFLAHYSQVPQVSRSVQTLVEQLTEHGYYVIMSSSATPKEPLEWSNGLPSNVTVYRRPNIGYDFGSWAAAIDLHPGALAAPHVLLVNDSLVGPFAPLTEILQGFESNPSDVWGLVDTHQDAPHLQSHWIGYHNGVLAEPPLRKFWRNIRVEPSKRALIERYEIGQTRYLAKHGYSIGVQYPFTLVVEPGINPTSPGWRRLLFYGFPFVKREIVLRPPPEVPDGYEVPKVVQERFGQDVMEWV